MDQNLVELLNECNRNNIGSSPETHQSFIPQRGWTVPTQMLSKFWETYCHIVSEDPDGRYHLGEKVSNIAPITAQLLFRFDVKNVEAEGLFDESFTIKLISVFQDTIDEFLRIESLDKREFICVYMENEDTMKDDNYLYLRMRLQFPFCPVEISIQRDFLLPRIVSKLRSSNVISHLSSQPIDSWEQIIDMNYKDAIPLYRSTKTANEPKLTITEIVDRVEDGEYDIHDLKMIYEGIQNHKHINDGYVDTNFIQNKASDENYGLQYLIPMMLSMYFPRGCISPKIDLITKQSTPTKKAKYYKNDTTYLCVNLLDAIDISRFRERNYWIDIGKAIYHTFDGDDEGLELWIRYTTRGKTFSEDDCESLWYSFTDSHITIRTIAWYARIDHEEQYKEIMLETRKTLMEKSLSLTHADVAEALYRTMWLEVANDGREWYQYKNHRWTKCEGTGIEIRRRISTEFVKEYEHYRTKLSRLQEQISSEDNNDKEKNEERIEKIGKVIAKLKDTTYKSKLMEALKECAFNRDFKRVIDTNALMMGVSNGVIEILNGVALFRAGKPEDYITMNTACPYRKDLSMDHPLVQRLEKWFSQVFVDNELRYHFYKDCSSFLYGKNAEKIFRIYSGNGDNSKSMIMKLQQLAFGQYACDLPITLITGQRSQSSSATPELAQTKGTHIGFLAEPDQEDSMKGGTIKALTGGDRFFARMLHDNGGNIDLTFKLILTCNKIPSMVGDKALKNRVRVIPFMSSWVDNPPATEEEQYEKRQFKKDKMFERQIPELAQAFLWLCVQYYPNYYNEGISHDPIVVQEMTRKYWEAVDYYDNFISERLSRAHNEQGEISQEHYLTAKEMYDCFKRYFVETFGKGNQVPNGPTFRTEMTNRIGPLNSKNHWVGWNLIENDQF